MLVYPNAKINLGLNIVEKRASGYHNIETVFYPIGLCDALEIIPSDSCSDYSFSSSGIHIDGSVDDNLIVKAYHLLRNEYELPPVDITLIKQIPFGAGLGGGSSDAAFTLKALNELFGLKIAPKKLEAYAVALGADCPFFIKNKAVFATGIGNEFSKVSISLKGLFMVLVKPDIFVSTPEAYSKVVPAKPAYSILDVLKLPIEEWNGKLVNDFEVSVFEQYPAIANIKQQLYDAGAVYASMSGSGSSVYALFKSEPAELPAFDNCFVTGGFLNK